MCVNHVKSRLGLLAQLSTLLQSFRQFYLVDKSDYAGSALLKARNRGYLSIAAGSRLTSCRSVQVSNCTSTNLTIAISVL
jgi:hypothetical protein